MKGNHDKAKDKTSGSMKRHRRRYETPMKIPLSDELQVIIDHFRV